MASEHIPEKDRKLYLFATRIVGDFGFSIAIPVVAFSWVGQYLDERWGTKPWLTVLGFALAALISGKIVYRKAKKYGKEYQELTKM